MSKIRYIISKFNYNIYRIEYLKYKIFILFKDIKKFILYAFVPLYVIFNNYDFGNKVLKSIIGNYMFRLLICNIM